MPSEDDSSRRVAGGREDSRVLRLAVERGLVSASQADRVRKAVRRGAGHGSPSSQWCGSHLALLVDEGSLAPEAARRLIDELDSRANTLVEVPWRGDAARVRTPPVITPRAGAESGEERGSGPRKWASLTTEESVHLPEEDLSFLDRWRRYEISTFLGAGGMGRVYKAWDPSLKRHVAIKFLRWNDPHQIERFLREARSQARVEHANICQVHEAGWVEGHPYIAMQFVDGPTLSEVSEQLTLEQKVQAIRDVALAIHSAHRLGLIHRDLKPGNILMERRENGSWRPYVVDFGLAQDQEGVAGFTRTGAVTGTPAYLSPEQARCLPVDRRSDVYSLGAVLYELVAGHVPLRGTSIAESLIKVVQESPEPISASNPRVPRDLETIIMKCLEKEPQRRYDSARSLADDLERFLDDEPITARPPSFLYRAGKWVRKNRLLTGVISGALVLLTVLGIWSLRAQWEQAERAALMQRFTAQVAQAETEMRLISLLPDQVITPHRERLRERLDGIRREMEHLGELGAGPGHYALGRGYLALHDYDTAVAHLERAWEAGYRRPEVAVGLGRALGVLYSKEVLVRTTTPSGGEGSTEHPERRFLERALSFLREAEAQGPYVEAMIAFYDQRFQEALARAEEATQADPWLYEARQLVADIYIELATREHDRGQHAAALEHFAEAGRVYAELLDVARSDAFVYAAECGRNAMVLALAEEVGRVDDERFRQAMVPCDTAIRLDPELADGYTHKAQLAWRWARQQRAEGEDPRPLLEAAIALGREAIRRNPREVLAYSHLGSAHRTMADWALHHGEDATPHLERAIESARSAIEIQPERPDMYNNLGNIYVARANVASRLGEDPRPDLERAIASYRESLRLAEDFSRPWANIGSAFLSQAEYEIEMGLDPRVAISESVQALRKALELNPNHAAYHNNLGSAALTLGDLLLRDGDDPTASFTLAIRSFERALELNPDYRYAHSNLAWCYRALAEYLVAEGLDPRAELRAAREAIAAALARNPRDHLNHLEKGRIEHLAGRWERRAAAVQAAPRFRAADEALQAGLAINERSPELLLEKAALYLSWAEAGKGEANVRRLEQASRAIKDCLELQPGRPEALALQGAILARLGLAAPQRPESGRHLREAHALLTQALERNPRLDRSYGELLRQVERRVAAES